MVGGGYLLALWRSGCAGPGPVRNWWWVWWAAVLLLAWLFGLWHTYHRR